MLAKAKDTDKITDEFYNSRGMTNTMDIMRKVVVKQAINNPDSELSGNNEWVRQDIEAIKAEKKSQNRKKRLTDILE